MQPQMKTIKFSNEALKNKNELENYSDFEKFRNTFYKSEYSRSINFSFLSFKYEVPDYDAAYLALKYPMYIIIE